MPRRRAVGLLFALDLVAFGVVVAAWGVSEMVGYSGRVNVGDRAFVFDMVLGEVALWTGRVRTDAPIDWNRDGLPNDEPALGGLGEPTSTVYDRQAASRTWQWFEAAARTSPSRGGDVGIFVL